MIKYETTAFLIKNISSDIKLSFQSLEHIWNISHSLMRIRVTWVDLSLPPWNSDSMNLKAEPKTFQLKNKAKRQPRDSHM